MQKNIFIEVNPLSNFYENLFELSDNGYMIKEVVPVFKKGTAGLFQEVELIFSKNYILRFEKTEELKVHYFYKTIGQGFTTYVENLNKVTALFETFFYKPVFMLPLNGFCTQEFNSKGTVRIPLLFEATFESENYKKVKARSKKIFKKLKQQKDLKKEELLPFYSAGISDEQQISECHNFINLIFRIDDEIDKVLGLEKTERTDLLLFAEILSKQPLKPEKFTEALIFLEEGKLCHEFMEEN